MDNNAESKVVKKLISINVGEYEDVLNAINSKNKTNDGSVFVCEAVRFFLKHKGSQSGIDETRVREIANEEVMKMLKDYKLTPKDNEEKLNANDLLNRDSFKANFNNFKASLDKSK